MEAQDAIVPKPATVQDHVGGVGGGSTIHDEYVYQLYAGYIGVKRPTHPLFVHVKVTHQHDHDA